MANTTNFGWETPDDTDLVKDGAAAMRTLGNAIDASLLDLKGGTTGQVLSKNTNADMDFTWVTQNDSDAIQNSIVDAKGDLISATADNVPARLASSGVNGQVLTVDTSTSTGLKWASPSAGFVGCRAFASTSQTLSNGVETAISLNSESFDTDAFHDNSTNNSRITIPAGKGGYYSIIGLVTYNGNATGQRDFYIVKNGSTTLTNVVLSGQAGTTFGVTVSDIQNLVAGDYIQLFGYQDSGGSLGTTAGSSRVFLAVEYLGA